MNDSLAETIVDGNLAHPKNIRFKAYQLAKSIVTDMSNLGVDISHLDIFTDKRGGIFIEYSILDDVDIQKRSQVIIRIPVSGSNSVNILYTKDGARVVETVKEVADFINSKLKDIEE